MTRNKQAQEAERNLAYFLKTTKQSLPFFKQPHLPAALRKLFPAVVRKWVSQFFTHLLFHAVELSFSRSSSFVRNYGIASVITTRHIDSPFTGSGSARKMYTITLHNALYNKQLHMFFCRQYLIHLHKESTMKRLLNKAMWLCTSLVFSRSRFQFPRPLV